MAIDFLGNVGQHLGMRAGDVEPLGRVVPQVEQERWILRDGSVRAEGRLRDVMGLERALASGIEVVGKDDDDVRFGGNAGSLDLPGSHGDRTSDPQDEDSHGGSF